MRKAPARAGCVSRLNRYIIYSHLRASVPPVNEAKFMMRIPNFER